VIHITYPASQVIKRRPCGNSKAGGLPVIVEALESPWENPPPFLDLRESLPYAAASSSAAVFSTHGLVELVGK
jgi:hypothetical protein